MRSLLGLALVSWMLVGCSKPDCDSATRRRWRIHKIDPAGDQAHEFRSEKARCQESGYTDKQLGCMSSADTFQEWLECGPESAERRGKAPH